MEKSAVISDCEKYRYCLTRSWDRSKPSILFVMLNPSTADANIDDPTIRRCIGFAKSWGYGNLAVCNLFAYRSTDPKALTTAHEPEGPDNDFWLVQTAKNCDLVVFAWGVNGELFARDWDIIQLLTQEKAAYCLGKTKGGNPRHPLYVPSNTALQRF